MTPEQALQILDRAVSLLQLGREDHARLQQAVIVLEKEIDENDTKKTK